MLTISNIPQLFPEDLNFSKLISLGNPQVGMHEYYMVPLPSLDYIINNIVINFSIKFTLYLAFCILHKFDYA